MMAGEMEPDATRCVIDEVIITSELGRRPSRAPDYEGENRALADLADAMSSAPETGCRGWSGRRWR
jgi:hypothetical protein